MTGPADEVRWQLLAGNGRVLAVSVAGHDDVASVRRGLRDAIAVADSLTASIKHPESSVAWTWAALDASGTPVARGDRTYARYGTCQSSFERFRRTVGALDPDRVAELVRQACAR